MGKSAILSNTLLEPINIIIYNIVKKLKSLDKKIVLNSTGDSRRPVVHINDVVKAITMCIENDPVNYSNHLNNIARTPRS